MQRQRQKCMYDIRTLARSFSSFLCSNFKENEGHIGLDLPVVCLCVRASVTLEYDQERLEIGSWNLICGISMKNKRTRILFSFPLDFSLQSYAPFSTCFRLSHCKSMEHCEQNISRTAWARVMIFGSHIVQYVDDLINVRQNSLNIWLNYLPFPIFVMSVVKQPCEQNIWITAWARIIIPGIQFGYMM